MNLKELREQVRAKLATKLAERKSLTDTLAAMRASVDGDTPADEAKIRETVDARVKLDAEIDQLDARIKEYDGEIARDEAVERLQTETGSVAPKPKYGETARIGAEKRTYSPDNAREGISFIADVLGRTDGDLDAMQRIQRHMAEERVERGNLLQRDIGTSAFAGLTVPVYLTDLVAPAVTKGRPLMDNCRPLVLPDTGNTVNISRITTATDADIQATENAPVTEVDMDDTLLTINVRTISGQQDISRQAIDRSVGSEDVVIEDLVKRYHARLDNQAINADGTGGSHLGIRSTVGIKAVTYTDATGTAAEAWGPLWDLQQQCETDVFMAVTHFVMHPRRWAFFASGLSTNQTLVQSSSTPVQIMGVEQSKEYGAGVRGTIAGLPVIVDANIPTNISSTQDVILGVNAEELFLWEQPGSPLFIRAEQPGAGSLQVKLVVYGYSAFTAGRYPGAHGTISGTGLGTPTYGIAAS